jgi:hypothetical protein
MRVAADGCGSNCAIFASYSEARSSSLFLGEGIGVLRERAAALCLFFQVSEVHHSSTGRAYDLIV